MSMPRKTWGCLLGILLALTGLLSPDQAGSYDATGNLQTSTDGGQTTAFTYDAFDRLLTARGGYTADYSYDANGNLHSKAEGGATVSLSYPEGTQPRPHAPVAVNGQAYTYDANGNLTARPGQSFVYDAENRLQTVMADSQTTTFTHDGAGQLVKRSAAAGEVFYLNAHVEARPLAVCPPAPPTLPQRTWLPLVSGPAPSVPSVAAARANLVKYYLVDGQRIASRPGVSGCITAPGPVTYYYHDHLGSTVGSSDGESTRYWPYGATRSGSLGSTTYQFTGQRREPGLGLYFYRARWYDRSLGGSCRRTASCRVRAIHRA